MVFIAIWDILSLFNEHPNPPITPPPSGMMARSARSPSDNHQDHVRRLLDQRAARADLPGPSPQFTDTPSMYSPSLFSPSSQGKSRYATATHMHPSHHSSSMLELDDDNRFSSYSNANDLDEHLEDPDDDNEDEDDEDYDQLQTRMSILGPKMRFHSRAPWETGEDALEEEDELVISPTVSDYAAGRVSNIEGIKKGFRFVSSKPRPSEDSESTRSYTRYKRSFETASSGTSHSQSPLSAHTEASTSIHPPSPHTLFRHKFSATLGQKTTPPVTPITSNPPSQHAPSPDHFRFSTDSPVPWVSADRRPSFTAEPSPPSHSHIESMHPYANPDLVVTSPEDPLPSPPSRPEFMYPSISRSDSGVTVTNSLGTSSSGSGSTTTVILTPDTSASSVREQNQERTSRSRTSTFQGKEISSPISVQNSTMRTGEITFVDPWNREAVPQPDASALPGWCSNTVPTFSLISLEEARAQRSRSATTNTALSHTSNAIDFPSRVAPFSEPGGNENNRLTSSPSSRERSTSAGTRVREDSATSHFQQSSPQSVIAPAKPLKHKKSGFMRIFNARDRGDKIPQKPSLDAAVSQDHQRPPELSKLTSRVPVPPIAPFDTATSSATNLLSNSTSGESYLVPAATPPKTSSSSSPRRLHPMLSINTSTSSQGNRAVSTTSSEKRYSSWVAAPPFAGIDVVAQSAPALVTDFPALKLRPVSTMFSAHFRDHIVGTDSESEEPDNDTQSPASSGRATMPVTPGLFPRSDTSGLESAIASSEDKASIIQSLQNQIASARKAWQLEIWGLEGQVRDLKAEIENLRATDKEYCDACGRGRPPAETPEHRDTTRKFGIVNRPRARTGTSSRFVNGS